MDRLWRAGRLASVRVRRSVAAAFALGTVALAAVALGASPFAVVGPTSLPVTGFTVAVPLAVGTLVVLTGTALVLTSRRRRAG